MSASLHALPRKQPEPSARQQNSPLSRTQQTLNNWLNTERHVNALDTAGLPPSNHPEYTSMRHNRITYSINLLKPDYPGQLTDADWRTVIGTYIR